MITDSLIAFLTERLRQIEETSAGNADALGRCAGLREAIAIADQLAGETSNHKDKLTVAGELVNGLSSPTSTDTLNQKTSLRGALLNLVELKAHKDKYGASKYYCANKDEAWKIARESLEADDQREIPVIEAVIESKFADILEDSGNYSDGNNYNRATMKPATMRKALMDALRYHLRAPEREGGSAVERASGAPACEVGGPSPPLSTNSPERESVSDRVERDGFAKVPEEHLRVREMFKAAQAKVKSTVDKEREAEKIGDLGRFRMANNDIESTTL